MVDIMNRRYVYVDIAMLQDPYMEDFLAWCASRRMQIRLYAETVWEVSEVKSHDNFGYVCEIVYGTTLREALFRNMQEKQQKERDVLVLATKDRSWSTSTDIIAIQFPKDYADIGTFMSAKERADHRLFWKLNLLLVPSMVLLLLALFLLEELPEVFQDGWLSTAVFASLIIIVMTTFFYGWRKGVYKISTFLELLFP